MTGLAKQRIDEQAATHTNLSMNPPDCQSDATSLKRLPPGKYVLIHTVDQCPIQIKKKCGFSRDDFVEVIIFGIRHTKDDSPSLGLLIAPIDHGPAFANGPLYAHSTTSKTNGTATHLPYRNHTSTDWCVLAAKRFRRRLCLHRTDLLPAPRDPARYVFAVKPFWILAASLSANLCCYQRDCRQSVLRSQAGLSFLRRRRLPPGVAVDLATDSYSFTLVRRSRNRRYKSIPHPLFDVGYDRYSPHIFPSIVCLLL